jgi:hypothetical protein
MNPIEMDIAPPITNLQPIILKPSPSSCNPIVPAIHIHIIPKAIIIIPAVKNGLKSEFLSFNAIVSFNACLLN